MVSVKAHYVNKVVVVCSFDLAKDPKQFVAVEGADHNDFIDVMGLDAYHSTVTGFLESQMPALNCLANPANVTITERSNP